jgi:non-specific serine/threonine protein kinase
LAFSYRFGRVEVRPSERQLLVEDRPAAIGARAFDVLLTLIERRDRVVSKNELLDAVWPGLVVEENNLQVQVSTLRKLLGPHAVATIPGRGYRFTLVPDDSGRASGAAPPLNNLPAALSRFIGRDAEIAEVKSLLDASRLVTLIGLGGAGKTRLSLQVAGEVLAGYPDGVWFVELASLNDGRRAAQVVAFVLGVTEEAGKPVIEALVKSVKGKRLLCVLDNCEHLVEAAADVAKRLLQAGPNVKILASSREPLHVAGESAFRVPALATPQAIQLFVDRARSASNGFEATPANAESIVEICRRLDGIPLAIELAAARVRALSVEQIAARLDDRFRLLTGGDPSAMPRQQTLRASMEWSYEMLSAPERILLRRLSVFSGGWTLEAAETVCAGGEVEQAASVLEVLTNLVEKSLVDVDSAGERFYLLESVRQYALELLVESREAEVMRAKHFDYYFTLAGRARPELLGPEQARWLALLDRDRDNLLAAHEWRDRADDIEELGLRLVSTLKQYWIVRGLLGHARGLILEALGRSPERSRARARALYDAGQVGYFMGLYAEARRELEEALDIARAIDDPAVIAQVLQPLGMACLGEGDLGAARGHLEEALDRARQQQEPRSIAAAINAMAQFHRVEGKLDAAQPLFEHVLALARELDDPESIAIGLLNLAMTQVERGAAGQAHRPVLEALEIAHSTGSKPVGQSVLEVCAGIAAHQQRWSCAAKFYGAAEAEASHTGIRRDPADEAYLAPRIAAARAALGGSFEAEEAGGRALALDEALEEARAWLDEKASG